SCGVARLFTQPQLGILHEETCKPYCSSCFFKKICTRSQANTRICDRQTTLKDTFHSSRGRYLPETTERLLCSSCKSFANFRCVEDRYERDKVKMGRKLRHSEYRDDFTCKGCSRALPSWGPRWWICDACGRECTDSLHPPWGFKHTQQSNVADPNGYALSEV
ncbi:hypothetical protein GX51_06891, partial [Blastomyces parvus]